VEPPITLFTAEIEKWAAQAIERINTEEDFWEVHNSLAAMKKLAWDKFHDKEF
jgi:hypothetical protein